MQLRAIVIGAGWAGEGHSQALRAAGVDVVAVCGRSAAPTQALAERLNIPETRLDWRHAISDLRPDIVAIATPAAPHREMAETAAGQGCHILCDKPLGLNAIESLAMLEAVRRAGIKHAYAPASCLGPHVSHARNLVADGLIGTLTAVESTQHIGWGRPLAHSWLDELSLGGGALNNLFTHKLAQVLHVTGGTPTHVAGDARNFKPRAPIGPPIHHFHELFRPLEVDETDASRWRAADADTSYSVLLELSLPTGGEVTARFEGGATSKSRTAATLTLYGLKGTLVLTGGNDMSPRELHHYDYRRDTWEQVVAPPANGTGPSLDDLVQEDWNTLVGRFAADIRGEQHAFYPTFEDGWMASEIIDMVRSRQGRAALPVSPSH